MFSPIPAHAHLVPFGATPARRACEIRRSAISPRTIPIIWDRMGMRGTAPMATDATASRLERMVGLGAGNSELVPVGLIGAIGRATGTPDAKRGGLGAVATGVWPVSGMRAGCVGWAPMTG